MKKQIQALACAAMLAVGGFNVYTVMGGNDANSELEIENVEAYGNWFAEWLFGDEGDEGDDGDDGYFTWGSYSTTTCYDTNGNKTDELELHNCDRKSSSDDCTKYAICRKWIYCSYMNIGELNSRRDSCK